MTFIILRYADCHSQGLLAEHVDRPTGSAVDTRDAVRHARRAILMGRKKPRTSRPKVVAPVTRPAKREEGARERMVEGALQLLAQHGLQGTSFSEVLSLTGAPRGSIYHHFPQGKEQLVLAALDLASTRMGEFFAPKEGASAVEITEAFLLVWRAVLSRSRFKAGCAILAVTVAADSSELLEHAAAIFRAWRQRIAKLFEGAGLAPKDALTFSATLIAASEGAVVLSRGEKSLEPFELVAAQLVDQARRLAPGR
jgi:TetR/AcrR family transcriptional regulator, lmrAB and yxaGH operons repressor